MYFIKLNTLIIFQLSGPPTTPSVAYKAVPLSPAGDHHKLLIGAIIAGVATAFALLVLVLLLKMNRIFKKRSGEGSVSSEGRTSQTPEENEEPPSPISDDKDNLVKNPQGMFVNY